MAIVLMLMAASGVWWSLAVGAAVPRRASMCLALANAALAASLAADAMSGQVPSQLAYLGSDVCAVTAFAPAARLRDPPSTGRAWPGARRWASGCRWWPS